MARDETITALPQNDDYGNGNEPLPNAAPQGMRVNERDQEILKECRDEAFYYRCVPMMSAFGFGTHMAVRAGRMPANPVFGSALKVSGAALVGFFLGKMSYMSECKQKLMADPQSLLGRQMRGEPIEQPSSDSEWSRSYYDEMRHQNREGPRPKLYNGKYIDAGRGQDPPTSLYEDMRRTNRSGNDPTTPKPSPSGGFPPPRPPSVYSGGPPPPIPPPPALPRIPSPSSPSSGPAIPPAFKKDGPRRNAYGDILEDV